ncbi:MAG: hypothetical protein RQ856_05620 [Candidatus Izemoplasmatales bacterium]|nr:hypothetical protein [Candidatus Izemoplasmatales bacterium]
MINYFKLQFNYLFSRVFSILFFFTLLLVILGIYFSANLDLGMRYLDGFKNEYYYEYLEQSLLIIQVVDVIFSMFVAALLASKTNEFLISFTVASYQERLMFLLARVGLGIFLTGLMIFFGGLNILIIGILYTPFNIDIVVILNCLGMIFLQTLFYQATVTILMSLINSLLVVLLPIFLFWFQKTIVGFIKIENTLQKIILNIIPSFIIENDIFSFYQTPIKYIYIIITLISLTITINLVKDCR